MMTAVSGGVEAGFTLLEMLITVAILGVVGGMAVMVTPKFLHQNRADSAVAATMNMLELARNRAVAERRNFELHFITPNRIQVARVEVPGPATTVVSDGFLENGQEFVKFKYLPDTPDKFGAASAIAFGSTPTILFTSDGSLLDSSGDILNGTVFLGDPNIQATARAITIFGATGLIRSWKWTGVEWIE